jgi:hypothetical protein
MSFFVGVLFFVVVVAALQAPLPLQESSYDQRSRDVEF